MKVSDSVRHIHINTEDEKSNELVDKIASFFETEESWKALKNCCLENDRSDDLRRLLAKALKE